MRPYVLGEDMSAVSVSAEDAKLDTLEGGYIARNPENHADQWYVAKAYFEKMKFEVVPETEEVAVG
jgi:hypothetical protein